MTLWYFLLLNEQNQLQIIRLRGKLCGHRKEYDREYKLFAIDSFFVEVCLVSFTREVLDMQYFNDVKELTQYSSRTGI